MRPAALSIDRGALSFDRHCSACHPGGEAGLGPALNNKPLPGFLIRFQVRHGLGAMPKFPERLIPGPELDDLVHYVKALRRHGN
jgi:mono/diheme cytochrome c family protein